MVLRLEEVKLRVQRADGLKARILKGSNILVVQYSNCFFFTFETEAAPEAPEEGNVNVRTL